MDMERAAIPAALFCISGPGSSLSGALLISLFRAPLSNALSGIPGDLNCRLGDPDAAVHHDPLA